MCKPLRNPTFVALIINLLKVSITKINNKGERGSPFCNPLVLGKNPAASPLTKTEKWTVEIQKCTHFLHFEGKSILSRIVMRKFHDT